MPAWEREKADYRIDVKGFREDSRIWVQGAMDASESERPKLILEDHAMSRGPSLENEAVRSRAVTALAGSMGVEPTEVDWFVRDGKGQIQALNVQSETRMLEHPTFASIRESGDLFTKDLEKARASFPDVAETSWKTSSSLLNHETQEKLAAAFGGLERESPNSELRTTIAESHEIDLSRESFRIER